MTMIAGVLRERCERLMARCERGELSVPVALMELIIAAEDVALVEQVVISSMHRFAVAAEIRRELDGNRPGCDRIAAMLRSGMDSPDPAPTVDDGVAFVRRLFDWSVTQSEEASVALYSLGSSTILEAATEEIVALLRAWGLVRRDHAIVDLGCGIGRIEEALARDVAHIDAVDLSPAMIEVARRRCPDLDNVRFIVSTGQNLAMIGDAGTDVVLAVDSFPYVVQSGMALANTMFGEAKRVLRAGGHFVILNFSYRSDANARDVDDVRRLADANGLQPLALGEKPFALWNGTAFRLRKRAD